MEKKRTLFVCCTSYSVFDPLVTIFKIWGYSRPEMEGGLDPKFKFLGLKQSRDGVESPWKRCFSTNKTCLTLADLPAVIFYLCHGTQMKMQVQIG